MKVGAHTPPKAATEDKRARAGHWFGAAMPWVPPGTSGVPLRGKTRATQHRWVIPSGS